MATMKGKAMKNLLLAGATGLLLAFAASGASATTVYQYPDGTVEYAPSDPAYAAPAPMIEGRAAYVDETAPVVVTRPGYYYEPHRAYYYERAPFPFSALPWNW
jgi:hypothetical protein